MSMREGSDKQLPIPRAAVFYLPGLCVTSLLTCPIFCLHVSIVQIVQSED